MRFYVFERGAVTGTVRTHLIGKLPRSRHWLVYDRASSEKPSAAVNIEFHSTLVSHFQQERLASFLVRNIGSSHDLMNLERLFAQSAQDIVSIIQHAFS